MRSYAKRLLTALAIGAPMWLPGASSLNAGTPAASFTGTFSEGDTGLAHTQLRGTPAASFTGTFSIDSDQREFFFTLGTAGPVTIRTFSYAGGTNGNGAVVAPGGFDPTLSLYDSNGLLLGINQDGGCPMVAADPVTSYCWDAWLSSSLPAGTYRVVLTQSANLPAGPSISDSFIYNPNNLFSNSNLLNNVATSPFGGQANFTQPPGAAPSGFWDFFPNQRTSAYALDIIGAPTAVAPSIGSSPVMPFGLAGIAYSPVTLTVQSATGVNYTWIPPASGLPPGMTMSAAGVLSGTPFSPGTYTFSAVATDGVQSVQQTETIVIYGALLVTTSSLPAGLTGQSYGPVQLTASGGSGTVTWSGIGLGGLSLTASGIISGTLSASSTSITVSVTDLITGQTATMSFSIVASVPPLLVSGTVLLPEVATGTAVSKLFAASGGTPPYKFTSANLPPGLALGAVTGLLSGTTLTPGNFDFIVNVSDSGGQSGVISASVAVLGFVSSALPAASVASGYSFTFGAAGGSGIYTYSATNLPAGLNLSAAGILTGTPKSAGSTNFTVQVSDGHITASTTITLVVNSGSTPPAISGGALSGGAAQVSYSALLNATGGSGPYSWILLGGALPQGLSLSTSGQITGTPSVPGTYSFTLQVVDTTGATASGSYTIVIAAAPLLLLTGNSLPNGIVGNAYPSQIFSASGGVPPYAFTISAGSLPPGLLFTNGAIGGISTASGSFPLTVTATDAANKTSSASLSILINPARADLILSGTFLNFAVTVGASGLPSSNNITVRSSVVQQLLNYTYTVTPAVPWLSVNGGTTTPGSLSVSLTDSALSQAASPTPYTTSLSIVCTSPSPCAGSAQTVSVSLLVSAPPAQLTVASTLLAFNSTAANPAQMSLPLGIQNTGGGTLNIGSVTSASPWVTVVGAPATLVASSGILATVTVNPSGLPAGYNSTSVTVNSSAGSVTVPVTLYISQSTFMTLSPAAGQFSLPAGGTVSPNGGAFQVSVNGTQPVSWSATVLPGSAFLSTSTATGSSTSGSAGSVSYSIDPNVVAQLPPGTYYGTVEVASSAVTDSPQDYQVSLVVNASGTLPVPVPFPAGLLFQTGRAISQPVSVYTSSTQSIIYQASAAAMGAANWLSVSPATGSASAVSPGASTISVSTTGLAQGVYTGLVSYAVSAAAVRSVNITLIVTGTDSSVTSGGSAEEPRASACVPMQLVPTQIGLTNNFSLAVGLPVALKVLVTDNCGNLVPDGQVTATFSDGDSPLTLTAVDTVSGIYTGTWTPLGISPQASVNSLATRSFLGGNSQINGQVAASSAPVLTQNAVLGVYNPLIGGAISPGSILQIYGSNLAAGPLTSSMLPLTTTLGGTSVSIGGIAAPLFYVSPAQINAQAPFELVPGNQYQVVINANGALTAPGTISVSPVQPGIASYQNGLIVAQHLDGTLISESSPAVVGTYIVLYLAGLGANDTPVADGSASPFDPLAHPLIPPTLTLDGTAQPYQFVGLTPGLVGLYQINFLVPPISSNGDLELVISQSGVASNSVLVPVHK